MQIDTRQIAQAMRQYGMNAQADALENGTAVLATACKIAGFEEAQQTGMAVVKEDCGCDGKAQTTALATRDDSAPGGTIPAWNLPGAAPKCYNNCRPVNQCLLPLLREARSRFDDHAWMQLWVKDPLLIHFDKIVSAASAPYIAAFPVVANARMILSQQDAQQLPYLPGYFKFSWKFSVTDVPDNVIVRIWTGPRGLTGLTGTTALIQIGDDLKLSDFECKDGCYFLAYPDLLGCQSTGIPDTRAIYIEIVADGLGGGGNQLNSMNMSMFKRGSKKYEACCKQFSLEMY